MSIRSRTSSEISIENIDISKPIIIKMKKIKKRQRGQSCEQISKSPNPEDYIMKEGCFIHQIIKTKFMN
jgi:hypothetical protein